MKLNSSIRLQAPRDRAWAALNDVEVLRACIPGCEALTRLPDDTLEAKMTVKVGPVSARFSGKVQLLNVVALESYRLVFTGQGGAAGFARGEASVKLVQEAANVTELQYTTEATVGGKLAQIGSRLIEAAARKLANDFFGRFEQALRESAPAEEVPPVAESPAPAGDDQPLGESTKIAAAPPRSSAPVKWALAAGVLVVVVGACLLFV